MKVSFELLILRGQAIAETPMLPLTSTYPLRGIGFSRWRVPKMGQKSEKKVAFDHPSGSGGLQSRCLGGSRTVLSEASQILN